MIFGNIRKYRYIGKFRINRFFWQFRNIGI